MEVPSYSVEDLCKYKMHLGVNDIFASAKDCKTVNRSRLIENLFTVYQETENKHDFFKEFLLCLSAFLTMDRSTTGVDGLLKLAAQYCVHHSNTIGDPSDIFIPVVFAYLFKIHNTAEPCSRLRVCRFINSVLDSMGSEAEVDEHIFTQLSDCMLTRLRDKVVSIRAQAVLALQRLQEPQSKDCPIVKALAFHMEHDPSVEVRAAAVTHLALTPKTLPKVLTRIRDERDLVRTATLKALARLKLLRFSLKQRQIIFSTIFRDPSKLVQRYGQKETVTKWFKNSDCNIISFLKLIDVVSFEMNQQLIYCLIEKMPLSTIIEALESLQTRKLIPLSELTPEAAVFWRYLLVYINEKVAVEVEIENDHRSRIIPELTPFTKYIAKYAESIEGKENEFILTQLLEIASGFSMTDEKGKEELKLLCIRLLKSERVGVPLVSSLCKVIRRIVHSTDTRVAIMAEIIADIRDPIDEETPQSASHPNPMDTTTLENEIEEVGDRLAGMDCTSGGPGGQGQTFEEAEHSPKDDPPTVIKCLSIIKEFLKAQELESVDSTLLTLKDSFVKPCMQTSHDEVVCLAIDCMTLMGLRSKEIALDIFDFLCLQICMDNRCVSATEAVFDLLCIHGFDLVHTNPESVDDTLFRSGGALGKWPIMEDFNQDESLNTPAKRRIVPLLTFLLRSTVREMKITACQGLCKLFLSGRLSSPIVLSQLVLFWFDPFSETEGEVRQPMCLFFSALAKGGCERLVLQSLIPSVRAVSDDAHASIDPDGVIRLFLTLLDPDNLPQGHKVDQDGLSWHWLMGEAMISDLMETRCEMVFVLARGLDALHLAPSDALRAPEALNRLNKIIRVVGKKTKERRTLSSLLSFKGKLEKLIAGDIEVKQKEKDERVSDCFDSTVMSAGVLRPSTNLESVAEVEDNSDEANSDERMEEGGGGVVPGTPSTAEEEEQEEEKEERVELRRSSVRRRVSARVAASLPPDDNRPGFVPETPPSNSSLESGPDSSGEGSVPPVKRKTRSSQRRRKLPRVGSKPK